MLCAAVEIAFFQSVKQGGANQFSYGISQVIFSRVSDERSSRDTRLIVLSDGYLANGSEPWRIPDVDSLPDISSAFSFATAEANLNGDGEFRPFKRDPLTLARLFLFFAPDGLYLMPHIAAVELADGAQRAAVAAEFLRQFKALGAEPAREALAGMLGALGPARLFELTERFSSERFLNWPELRALRERGVEIGAHADWHWPMNAAQSPDWLRRQARGPRLRIAEEIGECRAFAYPFGNIDDVSGEAWRAVRDAGYSHAFTTLSGSLDGGSNPWLLPRYGLGAREPKLPAFVPLLRAGNGRLARWQDRLAGGPV